MPPGSSTKTIDLTGESDYDIIEMMTWKNDSPDIAREAWGEFYRRHATFLFSVCLKFTRGLGGEGEAENLTAETFKKIYERGVITFKPVQNIDTEKMRRHVRAWISRIANNLACNIYRARSRVINEVFLEPEAWENIAEPDRSPDSQICNQLLNHMESVLSEREQNILRVTFQYYDPKNPNQHLPDDVLQDLANQWGITSENIRQIKSRAVKKLKESLGNQGSLTLNIPIGM